MKPKLVIHLVVFVCLLYTNKSFSQDIDESIYYRLTNHGIGESQSLDVLNNEKAKTVVLSPSNSYSGQAWKLQQQSDGFYRITCEWLGDAKSLALVNDNEKNKVQLEESKDYINQLWIVTPIDKGYFQISSAWIGKDKSLGVVREGVNTKLQLVTTSNNASQQWLLKPFSSSADTEKETTDEQPAEEISFSSLSGEEKKLYHLVMQYRKENGLPLIEFSPSLSIVAQAHTNDLVLHKPDLCNGNTHSWSDEGNWTPCCFVLNETSECMWSKPRELTSYKGNGFEIAHGSSKPQNAEYVATAESALKGWKSSPGHNDVILNKNGWKNVQWKAIGISINKGFAVIWFGKEPDKD